MSGESDNLIMDNQSSGQASESDQSILFHKDSKIVSGFLQKTRMRKIFLNEIEISGLRRAYSDLRFDVMKLKN